MSAMRDAIVQSFANRMDNQNGASIISPEDFMDFLNRNSIDAKQLFSANRG